MRIVNQSGQSVKRLVDYRTNHLVDTLTGWVYNGSMTSKKLTTQPTGALAERKQSDGHRRRIKLTREERALLKKQKLAEGAAALFLDMDDPKSWVEIAAELGISLHQLKDLTKSDEFNEAYSVLFAELGHDPRYKAALGAIGDMLPKAVRKLEELMTSTRTPAAVALKAVEKVLAINGIENMKPAQSDRADLVKYLEEKGVTINNLNVTIPDVYAQAMRDYEVVEGEFKEGVNIDVPNNESILEENINSSLSEKSPTV